MEKITLNRTLRVPGTNIVLEAGDRISMVEAFRHEMAVSVVQKLCNVVGRRLRIKIKPIFPAFDLKNSDGDFMSYVCITPNGSHEGFAVNFKANGASDEIWSVCIFDNALDPMNFSYEAKLNGYNIVEVVDQIADFISGGEQTYMESVRFQAMNGGTKFVPVKEKVGRNDIAAAWMQENPTFIPQIEANAFDYDANYQNFVDFAKNKFSAVFSGTPATVRFYCKAALKANPKLGNGSKIPSITVATAPATNTVAVAATQWDQLIDEALHLDCHEKWEEFEDYVGLIASGKRNALVSYGMPGTGKTHNTKSVLLKYGIPFEIGENVMKGGFDDDEPLITFLWKNKNEQVVVFDDCDSLLVTKSQVRRNLVKNLLDPAAVRTIGLNRVIKDKMTGEDIPPTFPFKARVICLSNLSIDQIDSAIRSRCLTVELNFTIEEMLEMIKEKLDGIGEDSWELTLQDKMEVYDFFVEIQSRIKEISFRTFKFALQGRAIANALGRDWRKYALRMIIQYVR